MANALITGITGQGGSYLAELLINKGYNVVGVVRNLEQATDKIRPVFLNRVSLHQWDIFNQEGLIEALQSYKITESI